MADGGKICSGCGTRLAVGAVACFACGYVLEETNAGGGQSTVGGRAPTHLSAVGTVVKLDGRWMLLDKVFTDETSETFLARDDELARNVVVRWFLEGKASAEVEDRARKYAAAEHPNLSTLLALGRHEGKPYIVRPRHGGEGICRFIATHPAQAARTFADLCGAVAALHQAGIAHMSLKSEHALVEPSGALMLLEPALASERMDPTADCAALLALLSEAARAAATGPDGAVLGATLAAGAQAQPGPGFAAALEKALTTRASFQPLADAFAPAPASADKEATDTRPNAVLVGQQQTQPGVEPAALALGDAAAGPTGVLGAPTAVHPAARPVPASAAVDPVAAAAAPTHPMQVPSLPVSGERAAPAKKKKLLDEYGAHLAVVAAIVGLSALALNADNRGADANVSPKFDDRSNSAMKAPPQRSASGGGDDSGGGTGKGQGGGGDSSSAAASGVRSPQPGEVRIIATLKGKRVPAQVLLGGSPRGRTPLFLKLKPGVYDVKLTYEGVPSAFVTVKVDTKGHGYPLDVELGAFR